MNGRREDHLLTEEAKSLAVPAYYRLRNVGKRFAIAATVFP